MRRKARSLVALEHPIGEAVMDGNLAIGRHFVRVDVPVLRIGRTGRSVIDGGTLGKIGTVHRAVIVHGFEVGMLMAEIIFVGERDGPQLYGVTFRVSSFIGDIGIGKVLPQSVEQVVGSPILLDDDDDMLDFGNVGDC